MKWWLIGQLIPMAVLGIGTMLGLWLLAHKYWIAAGGVTRVVISPDGQEIAAGDDYGVIHLWDRPPANVSGTSVYRPARHWRWLSLQR